MKLWRNSNNKLVMNAKGEAWLSKECPCDCEPKVIASQTVNSRADSGYPKCWDLTPYQGDCIAVPNSKYRLIETGACLKYQNGDVDANGKLVGLRCGAIFGEEEYEKLDGSIGTSCKVKFIRTIKCIQDNNFKVPELKKLPEKGDAAEFSGAADNDDLPF